MNTPPLSILILDDDPLQLKLIAHLLAAGEATARIDTFLSAADALARIRHHPQASTLILLDLNMPEMDGVAFLRQLKGAGFEGAVILVSGEDERILQTSARLAQAYGVEVLGTLTKPVQPEPLRALVRDWQREQPVSRAPAHQGPDFCTAELRDAVASQAFVNHYQPKVSLATGTFTSIEALVRWDHPEHGLITPDGFIPALEASGLIDEMTRQVLRRAAADAAWLQAHGLQPRIAVNVSAKSLDDVGFPEAVCALIEREGMRSDRLVLEITESHLALEPLNALDILTRLRLRRVGVSIDDFGTGQSSLSQLRDLPFDELKIDRSFVTGAARQPILQAILNGCFDMAADLRIRTVAEGIESAEDWDLMRAYGCDEGQGYFIARPLPIAALPAWHDTWLARLDRLMA